MALDPWLITDPDSARVLEELRAREPLFHHPEFGTTTADFAAMITDDYWEVGASGCRYSREHVLGVLAERYQKPYEDHWQTSDVSCRSLGPDAYVITYTLLQGARVTRRSTIWLRSGGQWRAAYHQGTEAGPVQDTVTA